MKKLILLSLILLSGSAHAVDVSSGTVKAMALIQTNDADAKVARAIIQTMLDEINTLRAVLVMPARTPTQVRNALKANLENGLAN